MKWIAGLWALAAGAGLAGATQFRVTESEASYRVRVLTHEETAFVNTVVIETATRIVVIDPGASAEHAMQIRALVDSTGKKLEAVLLTHAHIDHYGALYGLDRGDAPVIASGGVARQLDAWDSVNFARFGMKPPGPRTWPERLLGDGQSFTVDGVTFTMHEAGPGESYSDILWRVGDGTRAVAVIGDLAMRGLPPFLQSGHSAEWVATLERLERMLPAGTRLYIGHDVEGPGRADPSWDASILRWQLHRLLAYRSTVASITQGQRLLTDAEVARVVAALHVDAPENLEAFDFLITTSANVLAAELILEEQKRDFESRLQAVLEQLVGSGNESYDGSGVEPFTRREAR